MNRSMFSLIPQELRELMVLYSYNIRPVLRQLPEFINLPVEELEEAHFARQLGRYGHADVVGMVSSQKHVLWASSIRHNNVSIAQLMPGDHDELGPWDLCGEIANGDSVDVLRVLFPTINESRDLIEYSLLRGAIKCLEFIATERPKELRFMIDRCNGLTAFRSFRWLQSKGINVSGKVNDLLERDSVGALEWLLESGEHCTSTGHNLWLSYPHYGRVWGDTPGGMTRSLNSVRLLCKYQVPISDYSLDKYRGSFAEEQLKLITEAISRGDIKISE